MKVIRGLHGLKHSLGPSVVTVGVFDGVHIGHRKIIGHVVSRAGKLGIKSVVVTFDPHPVRALYPRVKVPSLVSLQHRIRLIEDMGVDILVIIKFTKTAARTAPLKFIKDILIEKLGMKEMYVGENFFFGRGAKASARDILDISAKTGFKAVALRPVKRDGKVVSSSLIRDLIIKGDIKAASRLMGRPVSILGTVVHGAKRGRILGFPTANIDPHHEAIPPAAVYAVKAVLEGKVYGGVLNIGIRPTFHTYSREPEPTIEVHLFGFNKDIYGRTMEVIFIRKLRDQIKFKDTPRLIAQIGKDAAKAKKIFTRS